MRGAPRPVVAGAWGLWVVLAPQLARAGVALSTEVSPPKVEVGDRVIVRLRAMGDGDERPSDPTLRVPAGITASAPNVGSQSQVSIVNGQMTQSTGISVTWVLTADRPGTYRVGPASVRTSSGVRSDRAVSIEVVPKGTLPTPPLAGQPSDPFNMLRGLGGRGFPGFPGLPGFPDFDAEPEPEEQLPQLPEEYRVQHAADPIAFVRARAVPRRVVVGEQVTLSAFAYAGRGSFQPGLVTEPSRDDFLAFNLQEDNSQLTGYQFDLDGQRWITAKIAEFALFPLKSGKLRAGEMSFAFVGRNYSRDPQGLTRKSDPAVIEVVEPPVAGRPPGYRLGDVGHYSLTAQVQPREVPAGGSISVVAKLEGSGNLPFSLLVPERSGVHFLEPQIVDQVGPRRGVVQGFRTFTYVVELSDPGDLDLGEVTLPFYDAKARAYDVARAALGTIKVTGAARPKANQANDRTSSGPRLKGLVTPPPKLSIARQESRSYWPSRPSYWALLVGLPLAAVLGFALSDLAKLLSRRLTQRRGSLAAALDEALTQLNSTASVGDAAGAASAAERALFLSIEQHTGLKGRGVLKRDLAAALERAAVTADLAARTATLLGRCDALRFAGEAAELAAFVVEVRETCQALGQTKSRRTASGAI